MRGLTPQLMLPPAAVTLVALAAVALVAVAVVATPLAFAAEETPALSPAELVDDARRYEGQEVIVRGEAIGEALRADDDHMWLNLLGGGTAVGTYVDERVEERIHLFGRHGVIGDEVTVRGVLNVACDQHNGEFDVHVTEVLSIEAGEKVSQDPQWWKLALGLVGVVIGLIEYRVFRRRREAPLF